MEDNKIGRKDRGHLSVTKIAPNVLRVFVLDKYDTAVAQARVTVEPTGYTIGHLVQLSLHASEVGYTKAIQTIKSVMPAERAERLLARRVDN